MKTSPLRDGGDSIVGGFRTLPKSELSVTLTTTSFHNLSTQQIRIQSCDPLPTLVFLSDLFLIISEPWPV